MNALLLRFRPHRTAPASVVIDAEIVDPATDLATLRREMRRMASLVDDMIDAWPARTDVPTCGAISAATGPVRNGEWRPSGWSCSDPGIGLTVAAAKAITRQHLECPADRAVCRIKTAAMALLIESGVLVPAVRNYSAR